MRHKALAIERDENLEMITELEKLYGVARDDNERLSVRRLKQLRRLRKQIEAARSPPGRRKARQVAERMLEDVAAEVLELWIGSAVCLFAAELVRKSEYDGWRVYQDTSDRGWLAAA